LSPGPPELAESPGFSFLEPAHGTVAIRTQSRTHRVCDVDVEFLRTPCMLRAPAGSDLVPRSGAHSAQRRCSSCSRTRSHFGVRRLATGPKSTKQRFRIAPTSSSYQLQHTHSLVTKCDPFGELHSGYTIRSCKPKSHHMMPPPRQLEVGAAPPSLMQLAAHVRWRCPAFKWPGRGVHRSAAASPYKRPGHTARQLYCRSCGHITPQGRGSPVQT
jgi:hypothetical protein